jgi:hypothetical protein
MELPEVPVRGRGIRRLGFGGRTPAAAHLEGHVAQHLLQRVVVEAHVAVLHGACTCVTWRLAAGGCRLVVGSWPDEAALAPHHPPYAHSWHPPLAMARGLAPGASCTSGLRSSRSNRFSCG